MNAKAFDPQAFSKLLEKLIGDRKVQDFASEAGISRYQVSRRLAASLSSVPRKSMLRVFASHAMNGVTYEELLSCCGYDPDPNPPASAALGNNARVAKAAVLASINDLLLPVKLSSGDPAVPCDFELIIGTDPEASWAFSCLPSDLSFTAVQRTMDQTFQLLMFARLKAYAKYSFLTANRQTFESCLEHAPINLNVNVSVILYSPSELKVIGEAMLSKSTSSKLPPSYDFGRCKKPKADH